MNHGWPSDPRIILASQWNQINRRSQRLAGEKHSCCLEAPALFVVRMDVLVPANGVLQPLLPRVSQRCLDLRTDICLTDATIQIDHKDYSGNLFQKRAILGLQVRGVRIPDPRLVRGIAGCTRGKAAE